MGTGKRIWYSMLLLLLCGCRTPSVGTDDEGVRVHSNVVESVVRDSVFVHDSIYLNARADTVYFTRYRTLYKERLVCDTVIVCDTLYRERVVTREKRVPVLGDRLLITLLAIALAVPLALRFIRRLSGS